ncbi:MAG: hypothetical protein HQK77_12625 [Desulfobacterales bacterium]|nr:hypothetical protein [Desulfobacterales bacterium]
MKNRFYLMALCCVLVIGLVAGQAYAELELILSYSSSTLSVDTDIDGGATTPYDVDLGDELHHYVAGDQFKVAVKNWADDEVDVYILCVIGNMGAASTSDSYWLQKTKAFSYTGGTGNSASVTFNTTRTAFIENLPSLSEITVFDFLMENSYLLDYPLTLWAFSSLSSNGTVQGADIKTVLLHPDLTSTFFRGSSSSLIISIDESEEAHDYGVAAAKNAILTATIEDATGSTGISASKAGDLLYSIDQDDDIVTIMTGTTLAAQTATANANTFANIVTITDTGSNAQNATIRIGIHITTTPESFNIGYWKF